MMGKRQRVQHILLLSLCLGAGILQAATGRISGTITDKETGALLIAANIKVEGTHLGAASDLQGRYMIVGVPAGTHIVVVNYIGYQSQRTEMMILPSQTTKLDFQLAHETVRGEAVIITAQAAGQRSAINRQINATSIKNVVSSARIQELPDATAAESIGRLPGISILRSGGEANKVSVRGLAPRFNSVQLEGVAMRSTDSNDRSTDISMISPNMLGSVEVTKALTPDMQANSLGGTVNLTIREAPENIYRDFSIQGGFDSQEASYNNYKIVASVANRFLDKKLGIYLNGYIERRNRSRDVLNPDFGEDFSLPVQARDSALVFKQINFVDQAEIRSRFGGTLVMDYKLPYGSIKFSNFASRMDKDNKTHSQRNDGRLGFGLGWNMTDGGRNSIDQMVNKLRGEFNVFTGMLDVGIAHSYGRRNQPESRSMGGWGKYTLETAYKDSVHYLDYINYLENSIRELELGGPGIDRYSSREREVAVELNYEQPYKMNTLFSGYLKFGGMIKHFSRKYDRTDIEIKLSGNTYSRMDRVLMNDLMPDVWVNRNFYGGIYTPDAWDDHFDNNRYFDGKYNLTPFMSWDVFHRVFDACYGYYADKGLIYRTNTSTFTDDQDGTEITTAGYIMTEMRFLQDKLLLIPGVRHENMQYNYTGTRIEVPFGGSRRDWNEENIGHKDTTTTHANWFPMVHLRVKPTPWMDVRLAWTHTASRPNYSDIVPFFIDDPNNKTIRGGNPHLKPQTSENRDLYMSIYANRIGLFTAGIFTKNIENLIWRSEYYLFDTDQTAQFGVAKKYVGYAYTVPKNSLWKGTLHGFELEWQTHFWYMPGLLKNLVLNVNYTFMESETQYPLPILTYDFTVFPPRQTRIDSFYTAPIAGQPRNVFNFSIGYDYKGFSGRISYLYQDGSLTGIHEKAYLNVHSFPYDRWDIKLRQKLPVEGLELFINLNNITDTGDKSYRLSKYYIENHQIWGFTADGGLRYRL